MASRTSFLRLALGCPRERSSISFSFPDSSNACRRILPRGRLSESGRIKNGVKFTAVNLGSERSRFLLYQIYSFPDEMEKRPGGRERGTELIKVERTRMPGTSFGRCSEKETNKLRSAVNCVITLLRSVRIVTR